MAEQLAVEVDVKTSCSISSMHKLLYLIWIFGILWQNLTQHQQYGQAPSFVLDFWKPLAKLKGHKCSLHKLEKFFSF